MDDRTEIIKWGNESNRLIEAIQMNLPFMTFIEERCSKNQMRLKLFAEFILEFESQKKDELLKLIYTFGSTLRQQDLMARQLFLWMLEIAEQKEE